MLKIDTPDILAARQPMARLAHMVMSHVGEEVLVYDETTHAIHRLNPTSHLVWSLCDGTRSLPDLAQAASAALGTEVTDAVVRLALSQLASAKLLDGDLSLVQKEPRQSRRTVLRRLAIAGGVALPVLVSISAPTAVQAQSCLGLGTPCSSSAQCCLGLCGTTATSTSPVCRLPVVGCPGGRCG